MFPRFRTCRPRRETREEKSDYGVLNTQTDSLLHRSKLLSLGKMKYIEILYHMVLDFKK